MKTIFAVSLVGTHLGHNLPDRKSNRYGINLISVAGHENKWNSIQLLMLIFHQLYLWFTKSTWPRGWA